MRALRFWRIWFEMASAVAVTVLLYSLLDNVWLAGLAATGIMALLGFVIVGVSPRQLGRVALRPPWSGSAPRWSGPCTPVLGPDPGLAGRGWAAPWPPARRPTTRRSSAKRNSANSWTGPPSPT